MVRVPVWPTNTTLTGSELWLLDPVEGSDRQLPFEGSGLPGGSAPLSDGRWPRVGSPSGGVTGSARGWATRQESDAIPCIAG
jgi:hypothetical protein